MGYIDKQLLKDIVREVAKIDRASIDYSDDDDDFEYEDWDSLITHIYIEERYGK